MSEVTRDQYSELKCVLAAWSERHQVPEHLLGIILYAAADLHASMNEQSLAASYRTISKLSLALAAELEIRSRENEPGGSFGP